MALLPMATTHWSWPFLRSSDLPVAGWCSSARRHWRASLKPSPCRARRERGTAVYGLKAGWLVEGCPMLLGTRLQATTIITWVLAIVIWFFTGCLLVTPIPWWMAAACSIRQGEDRGGPKSCRHAALHDQRGWVWRRQPRHGSWDSVWWHLENTT